MKINERKRTGSSTSEDRARSGARHQTARRNTKPRTIRGKIWVEVDEQFALGEGGVGLLRAIQRHGSLSVAAREIGWSYRHAWGYLRRAESVLNARLTEPVAGKGAARGTRLTTDGEALCSELDAVMRSVSQANARRIKRPPAPAAVAPRS
jgi:molybdate transport system regulatory protein